MKKRFVSIVLVTCMAMTAIPFTPAYAADSEIVYQPDSGSAETYFETAGTVTIQIGAADQPAADVAVSWKDEWFIKRASSAYNHELCRTAMALSGAAYVEDENGKPSPDSVQAALRAFQFDEIKSFHYSYPFTADDNDHAAYTFAVKKLNSTEHLVAIVVKGTSGEEWYSNFNLGTEDTHHGFNLAKTELMNDLKDYLSHLRLADGSDNSLKFLVTGHSRGAAVANLAAADLSHSPYAAAASVYGYTFATPTVSKQAKESGYENIFNIINGEDFVTQVPLSQWGFGRYGIDLLLPGKSYSEPDQYSGLYNRMERSYTELAGKPFEPYQEGTQAVDSLKERVFSLAPTTDDYYSKKHVFLEVNDDITDLKTTSQYFGLLADAIVQKGADGLLAGASLLGSYTGEYGDITHFFITNHKFKDRVFSAHSMAGYYSWLSSCTAEELFGTFSKGTYNTFKRLTVTRPADLYVYNGGGVLAASVVGEAIGVNTLAVSVKDGTKTVDLPNDQEYSIKITAAEEGSVSYTVQELSAEGAGDSVLRTVSFNGIAVKADDELTGKVNGVLYTGKNNYALTKNNTEKIYADYDSYTPPSEGPENTVSVPSVTGGTVSVSHGSAHAGQRVTVTAAPDSGCDVISLTVTDTAGSKVELSNMGGGKYAFTMPDGPVTVNAVFDRAWSNPFADVGADAWYYDAVRFVNQNGLMGGAGNGSFAPDVRLSRAMLAQVLYNREGQPAVSGGTSAFPDVTPDKWYFNAAYWAFGQGIIKGYDNGLFGPGDDITREQLALMLYRYAGSPVPPNLQLSFTDADKVSVWARDAVRWAVDQGILKGKGNGIFDPAGKATRAETAQVLKNYFEN